MKLFIVWQKQQPKHDLLRLLLSLLVQLVFFNKISPPSSFYSKTKMGYIFSFHSSSDVLIFTFDLRAWMTYLFLHYKEQLEQHKMFYWRRQIKQMCEESDHIICSFKRNSSGISLLQLWISSFLERIHLVKEKFWIIKIFIKSLTNQNFFLQLWLGCVV